MNTHQTLRQNLLALSCAAWLFSGAAHAQQCIAPPGGATCGCAGPASQGNTSGVNTGGGNPINLTNGNKYQMEVDLPALPGELGIEIVRHYNSAHRHVVGQLGMGWRLSYETDLYVVGQTVQILRADGARLVFNIDPKNPSLCAGADPTQGWVQILTSARGIKSYVWHWTHGENAGRQLRFDEGGKLVQIAAASGAVLSITRGPKGELLKVTDPQGRSLSFNHGGPGRVRQAEQAQQQQQQASNARNNATNATTQGAGGLVGNAPGLAVFTGIQSIATPVGRFTYSHGVAPSGAASAASSAQAQALAPAQAANLTQVSLPTHTDTSQAAHAMATTHTLYDESRQPLAELDAQGRITRQYVWLADLPLAVIDSPDGQALTAEAPGLTQLWTDVRSALYSWLGSDAGIAWLHTNHLGAPEAATNVQGQLVWRALYAPFGAAQVSATQSGFTLHLRLPGQVWDEETGLHYNRQRYYDPEHGQYLTPDPLGTPDGPNPYAYVAFNPLTNIDPDGLVLFAFDGTGNDTSDPNTLSNVVRFRDRYESGNTQYVTGVGTTHVDAVNGNISGGLLGSGGNFSGRQRIARMTLYFNQEADLVDNETMMDVDIIGFSRGAAQARDFANRLVASMENGHYRYVDSRNVTQCQRVNFRFMGLYDTVLSTDWGRGDGYQLAIPAEFAYVAQAVALNEYRGNGFLFRPAGSVGAFPLESIMQGQFSPIPVAGQTRIERGFLGSHSDIGGGFANGDLATVALMWMVTQATAAGVQMNSTAVTVGRNPVLHDKSDAQRYGQPRTNSEDRTVRYADGSSTTQREMVFSAGMTYADTNEFITYGPRYGADFVTGTVDVIRYVEWLNLNGYGISIN